jgi:hypothetical protein
VAGRKKSENIYFMHIQVSYPLLILLDSDGRGKQIVGKRNMSGAPRSWITPLSTMVEKILGSFSRLLQHKTFTAKENINLFSLGPLSEKPPSKLRRDGYLVAVTLSYQQA